LAEDYLTITTYYPSPYGVYNKLQSNKLAVGDTNADGELNSSDLPPADGQIYAARGVILKPQSSLPADNLLTGELAYKSSDKTLYHYDGTAWAAVGGSASSSGVTALSANQGSYTFVNAAKACYSLSAAAAVSMTGDTTTTYTDWRLPTIWELAVFAGQVTDTNYYWSTHNYYSGNNWIIMRVDAATITTDAGTASYYTRCVR
jgi:hypothetical protein